MKKKKVRNLTTPRCEIAFDDNGQPHLLELTDGTVRSRLATPWFNTKVGYFRVTLTIVGPKTEKPEGCLPLPGRKAYDELEEISNAVEALKQETFRQEAMKL